MRIRFTSRKIYQTSSHKQGLVFPEGFVLDDADVGTVLGIEKPTPEFVSAFMNRWVNRRVAEEVDGRTAASDPAEIRHTDELAHPSSSPLGTAKRGAPTPGVDDGSQVEKLDLTTLLRAELDDLAAKRGVDITEAKNKADVIAALELAEELGEHND